MPLAPGSWDEQRHQVSHGPWEGHSPADTLVLCIRGLCTPFALGPLGLVRQYTGGARSLLAHDDLWGQQLDGAETELGRW